MPLSGGQGHGGAVQKAFLRRLLVREGSAMLGRAIPFGIGAVVGGTGNLVMGRAVVAATRRAFGPAPVAFPAELQAELERPRVRKSLDGGPRG